MSIQSKAVKNWRKRTKDLILLTMGSKCVICDYNKCTSALELHHLDRSTKLFTFGGLRARPLEWALVEAELKKCILVCSNCHREIESNLINVSHLKSSYNPDLLTINLTNNKQPLTLLLQCDVCKNTFRPFNKKQRTCSIICRQKITKSTRKHITRKTKIQWPGSKQLKSMVELHGYVAIGKILGVSDNAIRKRLKKYIPE